MRKLIVFNHVSLDGYFVGPNGDSSWAHQGNDDPEFAKFVSDNARGDAEFLFGRVTYEMMASYWPTPMATAQNPVVAKAMNSTPKFVFSRTLANVEWSNSHLIKGDLPEAVKKLKGETGPSLLIFGSGSIIAQLAAEGLIDEYQIVLNPIVLGSGRTLFEGTPRISGFQLSRSLAFKNGKVFLIYSK
jgi:dihydrofolate reductase